MPQSCQVIVSYFGLLKKDIAVEGQKKGNSTFYPVVRNIAQQAILDLLGLTFQNDCKFSAHIKAKLCKANKCLHVLRVCRKEHYSQTEMGYLFYSIVLPNILFMVPPMRKLMSFSNF